MPNVLNFDPAQYLGFFVVFIRILGVFVSAPILGDTNIPAQVKLGFAFILSLVFFPILAPIKVPLNPDLGHIMLLTVGEMAVGLMIGFSARLVFAAVALAGEVIGFQMGISMAQVFDPTTGEQTSVISQIHMILALLLFVVLNGHHVFIQSLAVSFRQLPPGDFLFGGQDMQHMVSLASAMFIAGLRIGAPLIVTMLAANLSLGLISRTVPQMNVFMVGLPFTIALGVLVSALGMPFFLEAAGLLHGQIETLLLKGFRNG
ncbi:MAG: flagellar biosynthetic protein FliR [Deltaproteobacteria bacterium]|nr:flagellar biosynthetic protein FliR [Deltaproteobacteria bacterium]